ncbi:lipid II-degrading bacteriocin [Pectobacterium brasiliense]|nr:lipid II-degrading bacteriocin [Pectobacterium brasiliense]
MATYKVKDVTTGAEIEVPDDKYILDEFEKQGVNLPFSCRAGSCSSCVASISSGEVDQSDGTFLSEKQEKKYILTCCSYPKSDCTIETGYEDKILEDFEIELAETGLELFNDLKDSLPRSGEILSGVTAPFEAFDHYLFGNGVERSININDVGFNINVSQIPPIMSLLNGKNVGHFDIGSDFVRNTALDGYSVAAYLGNITMRTEGVLNVKSDGTWQYEGVIRSYNDTYDANPSTHRGVFGEWATGVLSNFSGKPYEISIPGELKIKETGKK